MATVPTNSAPIESKPQQFVPQSDAGASPAAFGALQGQAAVQGGQDLQNVSDRLQTAADQILDRNNAVSRVNDLTGFQQQAQTLLTATMNNPNGPDGKPNPAGMANPAVTQKYQNDLTSLVNSTIANHTGGPDSAKQLAAMLAPVRQQYVAHSAALGDAQADQNVQTALGTQLDPLRFDTAQHPANLAKNLAAGTAVIQSMANTLGGPGVVAAQKGLLNTLSQSQVQGFLDNNDPVNAQKQLDAHMQTGDIDGSTATLLGHQLAVANGAAFQAKNAINAKLGAIASAMGTTVDAMPAGMKAIAIGLAQPPNAPLPVNPNENSAATASAHMAAYSKYKHDAAEQASLAAGDSPQIAAQKGYQASILTTPEIMGFNGLSALATATATPFGRGLVGKAMATIDAGVLPFAANGDGKMMTPEAEQQFRAAVAAYQNSGKVNPQNGLYQAPAPIQGLAEAYAARGEALPVPGSNAGGSSAPTPGGTPTPAAVAGAYAPGGPGIAPFNANQPGPAIPAPLSNAMIPPVTPEPIQPIKLPPASQPAQEPPTPSAAPATPAVATSPLAAPAKPAAAAGPNAAGYQPWELDPSGQPTVWATMDRGLNTGGLAAIARALQHVNGVGGFVPATEMTATATKINTLQEQVVQALQNTRNSTPGEAKEIEKDPSIDIMPKTVDDISSYRARLMGADNALAERENMLWQQGQRDAAGGQVTSADRAQAMKSIAIIQNLRQQLGVPEVSSVEDVGKMPAGKPYRESSMGPFGTAHGPQGAKK